MTQKPQPMPWLEPGDAFPPVDTAWTDSDPVPGLLATGGALDVDSLLRAYSNGVFPWFSEGQPILWWSPDPRMVLDVGNFKLHRSLRKTLNNFVADPNCAIRFDSAFANVISACANTSRVGQPGTWILPEMVQAYCKMHRAGHAHSVEAWIDGELAGGLYCVNIGRAVFGESMFSRKPNASKIALASLVAFCRSKNIATIDCQQNTQHLASLGAAEISRDKFIAQIKPSLAKPPPAWHFETVYWDELLTASTPLPT